MKETNKQEIHKPIEDSWRYWYEVLLGNDRNSISQQMVRAIWDDVVFRLIIEDRKGTNQSTTATNQFFLEFLERNYLDNQVSAIRRELDHYPLRGQKGVFSLYSLVKEICSRKEEITRRKYFEMLDLTYDVCAAHERKRSPKFISMDIRPPARLTKDQDFALTTFMQNYFDNISGASSKSRSPDDLISQQFFHVFDSLFQEMSHIGDVCDKHVAHAAIPESRNLVESYYSYVSYHEIWDAHKKIFIIMNSLSRLLAGAYLQPLTLPEDEFFKNWDQPLIKSQDISLLKGSFIRYRDDVKTWSNPQEFDALMADKDFI